MNTFMSKAFAQSNLQFKFGDSVSIFAVKSYQSNKGNLFEAVGNVVIIHKDETLYGESASISTDTGVFKIEGNVRYIAKDITIYGSKIEYNMKDGSLSVDNARIATSRFYIVARNITKKNKDTFFAVDAEYSTCRDCPESWTIYGNEISLTLNEYVTIKHALFKINTVNVMYIPYLVLPAKKDRETGLLFPQLSSRLSEGISLMQPWFWAIADNMDMTFSPTFWAKRGYGIDYQYRHIFNDSSWLEVNSRVLEDDIYLPGKLTYSESGENFFRHFTSVENHYENNNSYTHHINIKDARDMDIVRDHPNFTDQYVRGAEIGGSAFFDFRNNYVNLTIDSHYNHNLLNIEAEKFDNSFVQILPKLDFSMAPLNLIRSDFPLLTNINFGLDADFTLFRQNHLEESEFLRNANRLNFRPYIDWTLGNWGPYNLSSKVFMDFQHYNFRDSNEDSFEKYAARAVTEFSFTFEKIFGLSYEEKIKKSKQDIDGEIKEGEKQTLMYKRPKSSNLVGELDDFEKSFGKDYKLVPKYSYKHSQNFKFIHHYISDEQYSGNNKFYNQITNSNQGWFDYIDAIRSRENLVGTNETRTVISPNNTLELQWNNLLVRKEPRKFNYFQDQRYLRDNFNYRRIGHFDISQGYELSTLDDRSKLTRLLIRGGYAAKDWAINFEEYFFHENGEHFFRLGGIRNFNMLNVFADMNINTFNTTPLRTLTYGFHLRPSDLLGFTLNYEYDLKGRSTLRSLYAIDYIPTNNCWKMVLGYRKTIVDNRISFDWVLNFGSSNFSAPDRRPRRL